VNIERALENWLIKNGINNIEVALNIDNFFDTDKNIINFSLKPLLQTDCYFRQFIHEYGCTKENIPSLVLHFLHEVGHVMTIHKFSEDELFHFRISRIFFGFEEHSKFELAFNYWESPEEFAANIWTINFINNNFQEVQYLINIVNSCNIYTGVI